MEDEKIILQPVKRKNKKAHKIVISFSKSHAQLEEEDSEFLKSTTPEERLDLVEALRIEAGKFIYEYPARLRRIIEVVREKQG